MPNALTPEQHRIMREGGTEAPFSGKYWDTHERGTYACASCGAELFSSATKFDSGTGWPSFTDPTNRERVELVEDTSHGPTSPPGLPSSAWKLRKGARGTSMKRTEVKCAKCHAHLGHVFDDGPADKGGKRYCINSACLELREKE